MFLQSCLFVNEACRDLLQLLCSVFTACPGSFQTSPVQNIPTPGQVGL